MRKLISIFVLCFCTACVNSSDLVPIDNLPFTFQVELELLSSQCSNHSNQRDQVHYTGEMTLGRQNQIVVALIEAAPFSWRFEGLACEQENSRTTSLCFGMSQSRLVQKILRAPTLRGEETELLSCVQRTWAPSHSESSFFDPDQISIDDEVWFATLEDCCQASSSSDETQALRVFINEQNGIESTFNIQHELQIELPQNQTIARLSGEETLGALALCGGPLYCQERFHVQATPQQ